MKPIYLRPRELAGLCILVAFACLSLSLAFYARQANREAGFWRFQYTNTVYIHHPR